MVKLKAAAAMVEWRRRDKVAMARVFGKGGNEWPCETAPRALSPASTYRRRGENRSLGGSRRNEEIAQSPHQLDPLTLFGRR